ncbi:MAG: septal ring lytic transglycosylase RlpA family protein [Burkholderiaceae bacterium]
MALAEAIADAEPRPEPLHPRANRPYQVFGRDYVPMTERRMFRERGVASWYGRKFQGLPTSTGEPYDMYAMTGAHPTLPLPSFVRVTHLDSGRSIVVRINDRGPFLRDRVIDLSAAAAHRLGYYEAGSAPVEVELIGTAATTEGQDALRLLAAAPGPAAPGPAAVPAPASAPSPSQALASAQPPAFAQPPASAQTSPSAQTSASTRSPAPVAIRQEPAIDSAPRFGHYVQLAAFGSRPAAEAAQRRLQTQFDWLDVPVRVVENAAVFRVQAGPYDDHQRAREMATRIERATGQRPWIVARP